MAEPITSAVASAAEELSTCIQRLPSSSSSSLLSSTLSCKARKIQEGIERLSRIFVRIQSTLNDAEEMEIRDKSVHNWLRELEEVALAAEDVLDEFLYEVLRLRSEDVWHMQEAIVAMVHSFGGIVLQRTEEINSRFDDIAKYRVAFQFEEIYRQRRVEIPAPRSTSSLVEETNVFGRENDVKQIKEFLWLDLEASGCNEVSVIAIVGMGGLGKTTLAQLVYNDDTVRGHFDFRLWVCVSENFDVVRLTRAMIESCTQKACHLSELDTLHVELKEILDRKRFLLVLDDVWEQETLSSKWDTLTAPLRSGSRGSKIIITTRNVKVSKMARATSTYHLPCLEKHDCLKLLIHHALDGRDPESYPNLMAIGRRISKKCGGSPLVAKTLGGLLHCEDDEQKWNDILQSDIWDIDQENGIMPVLKLSYQYLPVHLRRCFRYCSVFPKDYEFNKDELVRMWMAHGYIPAKGRKLMEDVGKEYFDGLLYRSFFQTSQNPKIFLMHDLIHDLARLVSEGECYSVEGNKPCSIPKHVQHLSIVSSGVPTSTTPPLDMYELVILRSFLSIRKYGWVHYTKVLDDFFTRIKNLRVLALNGIELRILPNSIGCLKHLRYLSLQRNPIQQLPESVGSLYHLQTIDLKLCPLAWLPNSMSNLLNLRHIICDHVVYPVGIRKLTNLQTLTGFCVSKAYGRAKLGELKDMNNIRSLSISRMYQFSDPNEAKEASLEKERHLQSLDLAWAELDVPSHRDDDVLENLRPNPQLERLSIFHFNGRSIPRWLGHPSFSKLASVKLVGCQYWTSLPPLGQLPSLRYLSIRSAKGVKYISREFFSGGFPLLETLELKDMENWISWCGAQRGECPRLRELDIFGCHNLTFLTVSNLYALESLKIRDCAQLQFSSEEQLPPALKFLSIRGCPVLTEWCQNHRRRLLHILSLEIEGGIDACKLLRIVISVQEATEACLVAQERLQTLELAWDCDAGRGSSINLEPEEVFDNLRPHCNVNKLVIRGFIGSRFATWLEDPSFSNLVFVTLIGCSRCEFLPPLGQLPHLMDLYIEGAHLLKLIGNEFFNDGCRNDGRRAFPSLRKLEFNDMPSWEKWVGMENGYLPSLCELILKRCPMLNALPHLPPSLNELQVANCDQITLPHSFDHLNSLRTIEISQAPSIQNFPDLPLGLTKLTLRGLPTLVDLVAPPSLRVLVLEGCRGAMVVTSLPRLTHLTSLRISDFQELPKLPLHNLLILRELDISNCPELISLECFRFSPTLLEYVDGLQALKSLERLSITNCPKLHFPASDRPPSALQSMDITDCPSIAPWYDKHRRKHIEDYS